MTERPLSSLGAEYGLYLARLDLPLQRPVKDGQIGRSKMRIRTATSIITLGLCVALAAATEPLPEGNGLASRYPGDVGIASDSAVVFADDFESYISGSGLASHWSSVFQMANIRISTETGNFFGGSKALEFTIPQTTGEVANSVARTISPERDVLFLRYYSKYDAAHNMVGSTHNGGIISGRYCCPGVKADGFNKFLVSYEAARFDAATPRPGELMAYVYHPDQRSGFGDGFWPTGVIAPYSTSPPFSFGPDFVSRQNVVPVAGRWYAYELMVKTNTPGQRNGRIALWLDGVLIADFVNIRLRETTELKIDRFTLDYHMASNAATSKKWYDNVVAATSYIGPMVTSGSQGPAPPTNLRIIPSE